MSVYSFLAKSVFSFSLSVMMFSFTSLSFASLSLRGQTEFKSALLQAMTQGQKYFEYREGQELKRFSIDYSHQYYDLRDSGSDLKQWVNAETLFIAEGLSEGDEEREEALELEEREEGKIVEDRSREFLVFSPNSEPIFKLRLSQYAPASADIQKFSMSQFRFQAAVVSALKTFPNKALKDNDPDLYEKLRKAEYNVKAFKDWSNLLIAMNSYDWFKKETIAPCEKMRKIHKQAVAVVDSLHAQIQYAKEKITPTSWSDLPDWYFANVIAQGVNFRKMPSVDFTPLSKDLVEFCYSIKL